MRKNIHFLMVILISLIMLAGCASDPALQRINGFSDATRQAMQNITVAFDTVEKKHLEMQAVRIVSDIDNFNCDPKSRKIEPFLAPEDLKARLQVITGLQKYAEQLAVIMGSKQLDELDKNTADFGKNLKSINTDITKNKIFSKSFFSDQEINIFTTSVNALGRWFIEYTRVKGIKAEVAEMKPHLAKICELLSKDLGNPPTGKEPGRGLRGQLWKDYTDIIDRQCNFIDKYKIKLNPIQARDEIKTLLNLENQQKEADSTLEAIQKSLATLKEIHGQLEECFNKNKVEIDILIKELSDEGKRIQQYYSSLGK